MSTAFEILAQFLEVVDLAVEDDPDRFLGIGHRLMPAGEVDDGEPAKAKAHRSIEEVAVVIGASMHHRAGHRFHAMAIDRGTAREIELTANPTHGSSGRLFQEEECKAAEELRLCPAM